MVQNIGEGRMAGPIEWPPGYVARAEAWAESPEGIAFFKQCEADMEADQGNPEIQLLALETFLPEWISDLEEMLAARPGATYHNDPDVRYQMDQISIRKACILRLKLQLRRKLLRVVD